MRARKQSPLVCFHKLCLARARASDPTSKINCASRGFWEDVKQLWGSLGADHPDRVLANHMSSASASDARLRRMQAKARAPTRSDALVAEQRVDSEALVASQIGFGADPMTSAHSLCILGREPVVAPLSLEAIRGVVVSAWPLSLQRANTKGERVPVKQRAHTVRETLRYVARGGGELHAKLTYGCIHAGVATTTYFFGGVAPTLRFG